MSSFWSHFPSATFKIYDLSLHWISWELFCRALELISAGDRLGHHLGHRLDFLGAILSTFRAEASKCLNRISWDPFWRLLEPRPEKGLIGFLGRYFVKFWSLSQKMLKSDFLGSILSTSGAEARKCLNRSSWHLFGRLLEPRPANVSNRTSWDPFCRFLEVRPQTA